MNDHEDGKNGGGKTRLAVIRAVNGGGRWLRGQTLSGGTDVTLDGVQIFTHLVQHVLDVIVTDGLRRSDTATTLLVLVLKNRCRSLVNFGDVSPELIKLKMIEYTELKIKKLVQKTCKKLIDWNINFFYPNTDFKHWIKQIILGF